MLLRHFFYILSKSQNSYFKCCGLWRNACCHKVGMTYPHSHTRSQPGKINRPACTVKNRGVFRHVESDNCRKIAVADGCKTSVVSLYIYNVADCNIFRTWLRLRSRWLRSRSLVKLSDDYDQICVRLWWIAARHGRRNGSIYGHTYP